jgi:hypothetical protein
MGKECCGECGDANKAGCGEVGQGAGMRYE